MTWRDRTFSGAPPRQPGTRPGAYTRIRGGRKRLGHDVARNTIKAILKDHGIEPAPERAGIGGQPHEVWMTQVARNLP